MIPMTHTISPSSSSHPLLPPEVSHSAIAKATLRDTRDWRVEVGLAINAARLMLGWSLKELAAAVDRDPSQVGRWINGIETPQFHALFGVEVLRAPLVIALARLADQDIRIDTVLTVRRRAS